MAKQRGDEDNSSTQWKQMGTNIMSAQESVGQLNINPVITVESAIKEQPGYGILGARLLDHGGTRVAPPFGWNNDLRRYVTVFDSYLPDLVDHGNLMAGPVVCRSRGMESNRCHENIARLWLQKRKRDALTGIATGYCLDGDLWRQHSWGMRKDSLLETLGEREKYFGIRMIGIDADVFAFRTLGRAQTNWPLFSVEFVIRVWTEMERRIAMHCEPSV